MLHRSDPWFDAGNGRGRARTDVRLPGSDGFPSVEGVLRILTLNIGSFFEADWDRRRHEIVAWVDELAPDIVCFQEVWQDLDDPSTAGWIAEHAAIDYQWMFGGHPLAWHAKDRPSFRFGSAILSRWAIDERHTFALPLGPDPEDEYLTGMPWELVHARTAGLDVFTCHLAAAPSHGRHRVVQVQAIEEHIRTVRGDRDVAWLARCFQKLLLNYGWWVNRKDADGNNLFSGGFQILGSSLSLIACFRSCIRCRFLSLIRIQLKHLLQSAFSIGCSGCVGGGRFIGNFAQDASTTLLDNGFLRRNISQV